MPPSQESVQSKRAKSAQDFLPIEAIKDGIIVLGGGEGLRAVVMVSSLNFALKSGEEQDATIFQYQNFLNSLDFSIQFVVQSRRLNIVPYLDALRALEKGETNELLKIQIGEYTEFIKSFVELTNIVSKSFYVIVPFSPTIAERTGIMSFLGPLMGSRKSNLGKSTLDETFSEYKNQLLQRVDAVTVGLRRMGLRTALLNTEEVTELFYSLYNPGEAERKKAK